MIRTWDRQVQTCRQHISNSNKAITSMRPITLTCFEHRYSTNEVRQVEVRGGVYRYYTMGYLRVTVGHLRLTSGHLRVSIGHLWVTIGYLRASSISISTKWWLVLSPVSNSRLLYYSLYIKHYVKTPAQKAVWQCSAAFIRWPVF